MMAIMCAVSISATCFVPSVGAIKMSDSKQCSETLMKTVSSLNEQLGYVYKDSISLLDCVNKSKNGVNFVQYNQKLTYIENDLVKIRDIVFKLRSDQTVLDDENLIKDISNEIKVVREKFDVITNQTLQLSETLKPDSTNSDEKRQKAIKSLYDLCGKVADVKTHIVNMESKIDQSVSYGKNINNIQTNDNDSNKPKETVNTNVDQLKNNEDLVQKIDAIYKNNKETDSNIESKIMDLLEKHKFSDERQRAIEALKVIDKYKYTGEIRSKIIEQFVVPLLREKLKQAYETCCNYCPKLVADELKKSVSLENIENALKDVVNIESNNLDDMIVRVLYGSNGFLAKTKKVKEKFYRRYSCLSNHRYCPIVIDAVALKFLVFRLENVAFYNLGADRIGKINKTFNNIFNRTNDGQIAGLFGCFTGITYEEMMNEAKEQEEMDHSTLHEIHDSFQEVIDDIVLNVDGLNDKEVKAKLSQDFQKLNSVIDELYDEYTSPSANADGQTVDQETKEKLKTCKKNFIQRTLRYFKWRRNVHEPGNSVNNWNNENGDYGAVGVSDFSVRADRTKVKRYFAHNFSNLNNDRANEFIKLANESIKKMDSFCEFHDKYIEVQPTFSKYLRYCSLCDNNLKLTWIKFWESYGKQTERFDSSKVREFVKFADQLKEGVEKVEKQNNLNLENFKLNNDVDD